MMTTRRFNQENKANGISIQFGGYTLHNCEKVRFWILTDNTNNNSAWVYSFDEAEEEAARMIATR